MNKSSEHLHGTPNTLDEASIRLATQLIQLESPPVSNSTRCIDASLSQLHQGPSDRFKKTIVSDSPVPSVSPYQIPVACLAATELGTQGFFMLLCFPSVSYWWRDRSRSFVHSVGENYLNLRSQSYSQNCSQWVQYRLRSTPI